MYNYQLFHNGKEVASADNQASDFKILHILQRSQSQSSFWAIAYEGWEVRAQDLTTGKKYISKVDLHSQTWSFVETDKY